MLFPNANFYSCYDIIINDKWLKSQHSQLENMFHISKIFYDENLESLKDLFKKYISFTIDNS